MTYKLRMIILKALAAMLTIITLPIFAMVVAISIIFYGILKAWRWVVRFGIDEELTSCWNELAETIGDKSLAIEF